MMPLAWTLVGTAAVLLTVLSHWQLNGAPGGDRGVGWGLALIAGHGLLLAVLVMLTLVLASVERLPARPWSSTATGVLFVVATVSASAMWALATPGGAVDRFSLAALWRLAPMLGPILLLAAATGALRGPAPGPWIDRLLLLVAVHAVVGALLLTLPGLWRSAGTWQAYPGRASTPNAIQQQMLDRIAASDPQRDWPMLLAQLHDGSHRALRAEARARLDALPDWQDRALAGLDGPQSDAVFIWLSAATPADPAAFAARLPSGIRREADRVRQRIRAANHPSNLHAGLMVFEVERVLAAVDRLRGHGTGFAPAIRELRDAFDEPTPYAHPRYDAVEAIDRWLRAHG